MPDVVVKTRLISRDKLAQFLNNQELIRAFENLTEDVSTTIPQAVNNNDSSAAAALAAANAAQASANAAQSTANFAQTSASAAQASANAAQDGVDALRTPEYLTLTSTTELSNERVFSPNPVQLESIDGGPGGPLTLQLTDKTAVLSADVSDTTGAFVNAGSLFLVFPANTTWLVDGLITFQAAATTTGIALAFAIVGTSSISGGYSHNTTATAIEGSYNIANVDAKGNTGGVLVANENVPIVGRWVIKTGAAIGVHQLRFRTEIAGSAVTLKAGLSLLTAKRIA